MLSERLHKTGRMALFILVVVLASLAFASYVWSMAIGFGVFYFTPEGLEISGRLVSGLTVYLFLTGFMVLPFSYNVGWVFAVLWCLFAACLVTVSLGPGAGFLRSVRDGFRVAIGRLFRSPLVFLPVANGMLIQAFALIFSFQEQIGVPTGGIIITNPYEGLFDLSYSAVSEEIGFRILPLGLASVVPLWWLQSDRAVNTRLKKLKRLVTGFMFPSMVARGDKSAKKWMMFTELQWMVLLLSSAWFGLAHVLSTIGWGPGKFTTAFLDGLVFGVGYLLYGAHVSILMHWFRNYYLQVLDLSRGLGPSFGWVAEASDLVHLALGLLGWCILLGHFLLREKLADSPETPL